MSRAPGHAGARLGALRTELLFPAHAPAAASRRAAAIETGAVTLVAVALLTVLAQVLLDRGIVVADAQEALRRAYAAWHGSGSPADAIGLDQLPLPSLVHLPFTVWPDTTVAVRLLPVPALVAAAAVVAVVSALLIERRVPRPLRLAALLLLVSNPVFAYLAVTGGPILPGIACTLLGFYGLMIWLRSGNLLWILLGSNALAIGTLTWYPGITWALSQLVVVLAVLVARRRASGEIVGVTVIAAAPIACAVGLWSIAVLRGTGTLPPWFSGGAASGAQIDIPTAQFYGLLALPFAAAVLGLAAYLRRRSDLIGWAVAGFVLIPLGIVVLRRALAPELNPGAGTVFFVILPTIGVVLLSIVLWELRRVTRVLVVGAVGALLLAGSVTQLRWMDGEASQPAVAGFADVVTASGQR